MLNSLKSRIIDGRSRTNHGCQPSLSPSTTQQRHPIARWHHIERSTKMKIPPSPKKHSQWPRLLRQVGKIAIAAEILLLTSCYALVAVPIGIGSIINSGDSFVSPHSKYWTDIGYMEQYSVARNLWAYPEPLRHGCDLSATVEPSKGTIVLAKGTVLRVDRIHRESDGFNYEFIDYYATIISGPLKGRMIRINGILRQSDVPCYIEKTNLTPLRSVGTPARDKNKSWLPTGRSSTVSTSTTPT